MSLDVTVFTDPACPWAYSAEPARLRLQWLYGDGLRLRSRMIVLAERAEDYAAKGLTPERLAAGLTAIQRDHGMPIELAPRERVAGTLLACTAVAAARVHAPQAEEAVLRRLRIAGMGGALIDDRDVVLRAGDEAGLDRDALGAWLDDPAVQAAVREDMEAARTPGPAARALDHKLAPAGDGRRRYTAPSWVLRAEDGRSLEAPGFQPAAVYEALVANLAPDLERRPAPESAEEVLAWAGEPLATAEVAAILGVSLDEARSQLAAVAEPRPLGEDAFWSPARVGAAA